MTNLLLDLPEELYIIIYKKVFKETLKELLNIIFNIEYGLYKISFTCIRCNARVNGRRCKKNIKTSYLLNNYCSYHFNNKKITNNL